MQSIIYTEYHLCWVSFMLSIIYAEYCLCWASFMLSIIYAEYRLCWASFMLSIVYAEYHLCWVLFMLSNTIKSIMLNVACVVTTVNYQRLFQWFSPSQNSVTSERASVSNKSLNAFCRQGKKHFSLRHSQSGKGRAFTKLLVVVFNIWGALTKRR